LIVQYTLSRTFPAKRMDGFTYMMDPKTWQAWSPLTIPQPEEVAFANKGDIAAYTYRPLAVPLHGTIHLEEVRSGEFVAMRFEQRAFGDVRMTWSFDNAGAHAFTLDLTVEVVEPTWWEKTLHRMSLVPPAIHRDARKALEALHEHFAAHEVAEKAS
jgi:hypothetical protein